MRRFLGILIAACITTAAQAAPQVAWKNELGPNNFGMKQVVADGTGGAAAVFANIEDDNQTIHYTLVWFNSAGEELCRKTFTPPLGGGSNMKVIAASRQAIVVWYYSSVYNPETGQEDTSKTKMAVIGRKGEETDLDEVYSKEQLPNEYTPSRFGDASGFFSFQRSEDKSKLFLVKYIY